MANEGRSGGALTPIVRAVVPLVAAASLVACNEAPGQVTSDHSALGVPLNLQEVQLPAGVEPVAVASDGTRVLIGGRAPEGSAVRPRLWLADRRPAALRELPVTPVSPAAFESKWFQLDLAPDGAIAALAGAPAGAHSNTRWSTWAGSTSAVKELSQPFETFGGWGAGGVTGYVRTPTSQAVVGSWAGGTGLDVSIWTRTGNRWSRHPTAPGSSLASRPDLLSTARGTAPRGDGLVIVGSTTHLAAGSVRLAAAVWLGKSVAGPWQRIDLPSKASASEAHSAVCDATRCTVIGQSAGHLAAWSVDADGNMSAVSGLPTIAVSDGVRLPPPIVEADGTHGFVIAEGVDGHFVTVAPAGGVSDRRYRAPGVPVSVALRPPTLWVVHQTDDGHNRLHTFEP